MCLQNFSKQSFPLYNLIGSLTSPYANCLHEFPTEVSRDKHESYCKANEAIRIEMPSWKPYVRYTKGQYQLKVPFVMYADFESLLVKPPDNSFHAYLC